MVYYPPNWDKYKIENYKVISAEHFDFYYKHINQISGSATESALNMELPEYFGVEYGQHINNIDATIEFLNNPKYIKPSSVVIRGRNCIVLLPDDFVITANDGDVLVHVSFDVEQWSLQSVETGTHAV